MHLPSWELRSRDKVKIGREVLPLYGVEHCEWEQPTWKEQYFTAQSSSYRAGAVKHYLITRSQWIEQERKQIWDGKFRTYFYTGLVYSGCFSWGSFFSIFAHRCFFVLKLYPRVLEKKYCQPSKKSNFPLDGHVTMLRMEVKTERLLLLIVNRLEWNWQSQCIAGFVFKKPCGWKKRGKIYRPSNMAACPLNRPLVHKIFCPSKQLSNSVLPWFIQFHHKVLLT